MQSRACSSPVLLCGASRAAWRGHAVAVAGHALPDAVNWTGQGPGRGSWPSLWRTRALPTSVRFPGATEREPHAPRSSVTAAPGPAPCRVS